VELVNETAHTEPIPVQFDFVQGLGDDAVSVRCTRAGSLPIRTLESSIARISTVDLLVAIVEKLHRATVAHIRSF
jgi:putative aminopeptidase FrvX